MPDNPVTRHFATYQIGVTLACGQSNDARLIFARNDVEQDPERSLFVPLRAGLS